MNAELWTVWLNWIGTSPGAAPGYNHVRDVFEEFTERARPPARASRAPVAQGKEYRRLDTRKREEAVRIARPARWVRP